MPSDHSLSLWMFSGFVNISEFVNILSLWTFSELVNIFWVCEHSLSLWTFSGFVNIFWVANMFRACDWLCEHSLSLLTFCGVVNTCLRLRTPNYCVLSLRTFSEFVNVFWACKHFSLWTLSELVNVLSLWESKFVNMFWACEHSLSLWTLAWVVNISWPC